MAVFLGFGVLLVSSCSFLVSFCSFLLLGGLGGFPGVCRFFLSLVVFLCLFFLVPFFFLFLFCSSWLFLFLSCSFLVSSCFFCSCFGGAWVVFQGLGIFIVPFLFVLLVPFFLVWGAWVVFLGFGGSSCSCLVSSCSFSSCFGGLGGFPGVWGFFLFFSCFFF